MKKLFSICLVILLSLGLSSAAFASYERMQPIDISQFTQGPNVIVKDKHCEVNTVLKDDITYVPMTFFTELNLVPFDVNEPILIGEEQEKNDGSVSLITDFINQKVLIFCKYIKPDEEKTFFISSPHTYVQLRSTAEFFGFNVQYDKDTNTVTITKNVHQTENVN